MTGTLFAFEDGSKVVTTSDSSLKVQVDNTALLEKYQFIYDYAPRMWLSERDNGYWPGTLQDFFDNTEGVSDTEGTYRCRLTTRVPLTGPYDRPRFLYGTKPKKGKGVTVQTFILPVGADSSDMDPLEMLLNPEAVTVEVTYTYFMPFSHVKWGIGSHIGDIEKT